MRIYYRKPPYQLPGRCNPGRHINATLLIKPQCSTVCLIAWERDLNDLRPLMTSRGQSMQSTRRCRLPLTVMFTCQIIFINQGNTYYKRAERTGSIDDNDRSVRSFENALSIMSKTNSNRPICLHNLTHSLIFRFQNTKSMKDLEKALLNQEEALASLPSELRRHAWHYKSKENPVYWDAKDPRRKRSSWRWDRATRIADLVSIARRALCHTRPDKIRFNVASH